MNLTEVVFKTDIVPNTVQIITLYREAGLPRPIDDAERIGKMFAHSNLIVSASQGDRLVGVCRCITDWVWSCYLSDLAVSPDVKAKRIGRRLIEIVKEKTGDQTMILLLSVPTAMEYYPKVGFSKENRAFIIDRKE